MAPIHTKPLRIGVLVINTIQLLDLAAIDLFTIMTPEWLGMCKMPESTMDLAVPSEIHYIGTVSTTKLTSDLSINLTDSVSSTTVSPGNLDVILVPGAEPSAVPTEEVKEWLRGHNAAGATILLICTGCRIGAYSGILDGKHATGPRLLLNTLRKQFPQVAEWEERRWVKDGNIWSSGGITNGLDMVVAYLRDNHPHDFVNMVCDFAEFTGREREYETPLTWGF